MRYSNRPHKQNDQLRTITRNWNISAFSEMIKLGFLYNSIYCPVYSCHITVAFWRQSIWLGELSEKGFVFNRMETIEWPVDPRSRDHNRHNRRRQLICRPLNKVNFVKAILAGKPAWEGLYYVSDYCIWKWSTEICFNKRSRLSENKCWNQKKPLNMHPRPRCLNIVIYSMCSMHEGYSVPTRSYKYMHATWIDFCGFCDFTYVLSS